MAHLPTPCLKSLSTKYDYHFDRQHALREIEYRKRMLADDYKETKIEDLMRNLVTQDNLTIIIVTHNMQQAGRVSDYTAYMNITQEGGPGRIVEFGETTQIFSTPRQKDTEDYITGRKG